MFDFLRRWWGAPGPADSLFDSQAERNAAWSRGDDADLDAQLGAFGATDLNAFAVSAWFSGTKLLSDQGALLDLPVLDDDNRPLPVDVLPAWAGRYPVRGMTCWAWKKRTLLSCLVRGFVAFEVLRRDPLTGLPDVIRPLPFGWRHLSITDTSDSPGTTRRDDLEASIVRFHPGGDRGVGGCRELREIMSPTDMDGDVIVLRYADDGSLEGISPLRHANAVITLALASQAHALQYHRTGGKPLWAMSVENASDDALNALGKKVKSARSNPTGRFDALISDGKIEVKDLAATGRDAQLVEARKLAVNETARLLNIPAMLLSSDQSAAWTTGISELRRTLLVFALQPLLRFLSEGLTWACLPEGQTARFDTSEAQRADPEKHVESLVVAGGGPFRTLNEVRALDNLPPVADGDVIRSTPAEQPSVDPSAGGGGESPFPPEGADDPGSDDESEVSE